MNATPHEKMYEILRLKGFNGNFIQFEGFTYKMYIGNEDNPSEADILEDLDVIKKLEIMRNICDNVKPIRQKEEEVKQIALWS